MAFTLLHPIHPETVAEVHLISILFIVSRKKCQKVMTSLSLGLNCSNPFGDCDYSCLVVLGFHVADCGWSLLDLSLSPFLAWFVYNALKNSERWSCATVSSTKVYPKCWSPITSHLWRGSARCPLQGRTLDERIWWPLWNSTWNRGTSVFGNVWTMIFHDIPIYAHMLNQGNMAQTNNMLCSLPQASPRELKW